MNSRTRLGFQCALALCAAMAMSHLGRAQVLYGSLTGNVTDPSSAAIPKAKVDALNMDTGVARQSETDARGAFMFSNLQAGVYKVTVTAQGFQTTIEDRVQVNVNEVMRADFHVQLASATSSVEVSATAATLQTDRADVHQDITPQEVEDLPYSGGEGKNFQSLLFLIPGAGIIAAPEANSEAGNPQRAQTLFMNGVSSQGNNTKLDGATDAYPWLPVNIAYVPPSESIQVVNVTTNAFDAEQGEAGGAAVNVVIKSGTNQLHGSLFERNQNNDMQAVQYFGHTAPLTKNIFNQFGASLGGPIWIPKIVHGKNKLFFFADYQGSRRTQFASDTNLTLPTTAMRTGDFSATGVTIYDPLTGNVNGSGRTPFAGNVIPANRISSAAATLTGLLPSLTRPSQFINNYDAYGDTYSNRDNEDFKVNYNPNVASMIWGRYSISPMDIYAPLVLGPAGGDAFAGGNPGHAGGRVQITAAGFTHTFTPTLLMDGNVGFTRQNIGANGDPQDGDYGTDVLHIPGANGVGPNYEGIPGFQITGLANIGNTNTGSPFKFRDNQYTTAINVSKVKGSHSLRFGFEYDKSALNQFQPQGGTFGTARGTFGFDGSLTALQGGAAINANGVPANSFAQFLLGFPSETGKVTQFQDPNALRFATWALYARDQWQVTSKLTLNYGLRWEYYPIFSHDNYGAVRFNPANDDILIGGEGGVPWNAGADATKKGFAPRVGVAYRLGSKTVIRSGYGISVDPDNMRNQRNAYPSVVNNFYQPPNTYQFVSYAGVANSDQATHVSLSDGIPTPTFPVISTGTITPSTVASPTTYLPNTSTSTFAQYMNRGYYQTWNFFVQQEISPTFSAEAGYVGTHGVHLQLGVNINGSAPGTGTAGRQFYPYLQTDLNSYEPFGDSTYNALQMRLRKRIGTSLIGVSYTFSKAIDNINGDNGDGTLFRAYPVSYALDKAISGFDRTHTFQLYYVYQLPFGKGHTMLNTGLAAAIFGGFQLSSTLSRFSGLPFTVSASGASLNAAGQSQTADQVLPNVAILGGHDPNTPYFNGAAFAPITTARLGTSGRDLLFGPGVFTMNQSISRTFSIKERFKLQIMGEAFNLTNTPNFSNPGATYAAPTVGANGNITSYGNYSVISSVLTTQGVGPRIIQLGGYVRF